MILFLISLVAGVIIGCLLHWFWTTFSGDDADY